MTYGDAQEVATRNGLGHVHFQFNVARNTGKEFEVGYVSVRGARVLFCKRQSWASEDAFYLCNEFRGLEAASDQIQMTTKEG